MAERELRRMNRMELIEIIYALKQHEEELERQNAKLCRQLADRTLRLEQVGSIAEAALSLNQNILILQGWVHAVTRHLQHRQQVGCQQHRNGCHNDQRIDRAFQHALVTSAVRQAFALLRDLLHRGNLNAFSAQSLHFQYAPSPTDRKSVV